MIKRTLTQTDIFLIVVNLLPVFGVWFFGWNPKDIFIVYCLETIIIGLFTLLKMGIVTAIRKTDYWYNEGVKTKQPGWLFMLFFLLHYGFFVTLQVLLFLQVSGIGDAYNIHLIDFLLNWPKLIGNGVYILLGSFVAFYGFKNLTEFFISNEYKTIPLSKLMFQPYIRVFIQQLTVITGSIFLNFKAGALFILIFALTKIFFEIFIDFEGKLNTAVREMEKESRDLNS